MRAIQFATILCLLALSADAATNKTPEASSNPCSHFDDAYDLWDCFMSNYNHSSSGGTEPGYPDPNSVIEVHHCVTCAGDSCMGVTYGQRQCKFLENGTCVSWGYCAGK